MHKDFLRFHQRQLFPVLAGLVLLIGPATGGSSAPPGKTVALPTPPPKSRTDMWQVDFDSAALWRVSDNTFIDYFVLPQTVSLRLPAHFRMTLEDDDQLVVRTRFTLIGAAIARGPEHYYFGWTCSPSIEYWFGERTYAHLSVGGGFGWIDSQDVPGGQGRDFCYSFFGHAGIRHYFTDSFAVGIGLYYQHWSNRGATDPNPGLDAMGPMIGFTWDF